MPQPRSIVICSGGLDSTVLLYYARTISEPHVLSFDYGQRHSKELEFAARTCAKLGVVHDIVDLTSCQHLLASALTYSEEVPHGHYAADTMKKTVVPNRNAIMLSIAFGAALTDGASKIYVGAHAGDHDIYPDCRESFFADLNRALHTGNDWADPMPSIDASFVNLTKANIVEIGQQYGVPFAETWSCYEGGDVHCGRCGTCVERREAFHLARVEDPTQYQDEDFWKKAVQHG